MNKRPDCAGCGEEQGGWIGWGTGFICANCLMRAQAKKAEEMKRYLE